MPFNVKHREFPARDLGWTANSVRDPAGWSPREVENITGITQMLGKKGVVRYRDYRDHGTFANMIADLGADTAVRHTVLIPDEVVIATDTTIPANLTLIRIADGMFTIASSCTLTFASGSKLITEPGIPAFNIDGSSSWIGQVELNEALDFVTPEMFGGGETALANLYYWNADGKTLPVHIIKNMTISGYVSLHASIDIAYIKPGVTIVVAEGATFEINTMSAIPSHDTFTGVVTIGAHVRGPQVENVLFRLRNASTEPDVADIPAGLVAAYFFDIDGEGIQLRIKDSSGVVRYINTIAY